MLDGVEREDGEQRRGGFSRTDLALGVRQTMSGEGPSSALDGAEVIGRE